MSGTNNAGVNTRAGKFIAIIDKLLQIFFIMRDHQHDAYVQGFITSTCPKDVSP